MALRLRTSLEPAQTSTLEEAECERSDVRFGSKADICTAIGHVRFAPNSDRESGFPRKVMSALPPKADMCDATSDVRFGPIADISESWMRRSYSIISSAIVSRPDGMFSDSALAVFRLSTSSNFVA